MNAICIASFRAVVLAGALALAVLEAHAQTAPPPGNTTFSKLPVPAPHQCPIFGPSDNGVFTAAWPWQIKKEWERIGGPSSPIGCPTSGFNGDDPIHPKRGFVQFEHGEIAISPGIWTNGVVAAYQDDWCGDDGSCAKGGIIVVDWNISWTEPPPTTFNKFLVRWDYNGTHYDDGTPCNANDRGFRGDGDQCDVLADMTAVQVVLAHYYQDTHLYTKGTFVVPTDHGYGDYRIVVKGCNEGSIVGDACDPDWTQPVVVHFQQSNNLDHGFPVDFTSVPNVEPNTLANTLALQYTFFQRAAAITLYNACKILPWKAYRNEQGYGDIILAKLAYADFYNDDHCPGRTTANRDEAFASLLEQQVESKTGTTIGTCNPFALGCRTGEYDVALSGYVAALYRFGSILPPNVHDHIMNDLLDVRGPLDEGDFVVKGFAPETENHLLLIESARYLSNDLLFGKTGDPQYNNDTNGYTLFTSTVQTVPSVTQWWLTELRTLLMNDFIEYNARPYQSYAAIALQNLYSYAHNPDVKTAAGMVLDYISAKMAMSSDQARRTVPYRRRDDANWPFLLTWKADTQVARNLALAGNLDILASTLAVLSLEREEKGKYWAPAYGSGDMLRAVLSSYRIPDLLLDLIINRDHQPSYQGLHHYADELYASSPSFLISAGGHFVNAAYTVAGLGNSEDRGITVPTTIMPTGGIDVTSPGPSRLFIDRDWLPRFDGAGDFVSNMCVAPNFACGYKPNITNFLGNQSNMGKHCVFADGPHPDWTFFNFSGPICNPTGGAFGFYLAVYSKNDLGFFEAFDTKVNPNLAFQGKPTAFVQKVLERNSNISLSPEGVNTYVTITGEVVQFTVMARTSFLYPTWESRIVSITNGPSVPNGASTPMAFGDIVRSQAGSGVMTISNSYTGEVRTLDFHDPAHPVVSDSNITPFTSVTCLTGFVWRQAYRRVAAQEYDFVCVTEATYLQVQGQNALGPSRTAGDGTCLPGFVFRQADPADNVCVTPAEAAEVSFDNLLAPSRRAIP